MISLRPVAFNSLFDVMFSTYDKTQESFMGLVPDFLLNDGVVKITPKSGKKINSEALTISTDYTTAKQNTYFVVLSDGVQINGKSVSRWNVLIKKEPGLVNLNLTNSEASVAIIFEAED